MSKILIIDDELEICKQVSLILNKNDFNSSYVTSYEEFLNLHKNNFDFDLVLVDLWLKNSSKQGIDIINELKKNYNDLVIISFSGHANIDNAIESVKAGANDFIEKPFETKKLLHIIQKNLLELKQKVTINNYRNQISFHSKINKIGFSEIIDNYDAAKFAKELSNELGGKGGGGRKDFAQSGGGENTVEKVNLAFERIIEKIT